MVRGRICESRAINPTQITAIDHPFLTFIYTPALVQQDYWGQDADWWLLETAGIPFGLTGDMIREGPVGADGNENPAACPDPNRWLGAPCHQLPSSGSVWC